MTPAAFTPAAFTPAAFIGHGNPMNALTNNDFTSAWSAFGQRVGIPSAVLVISAHWYIGATAVTAMSWPRTIHDFSGFPAELSAFKYPAPGSPSLAKHVAELLAPTTVILDETKWGLDHGTWSVLTHVFPKADVPVVQLSIDARQSPEWHVELSARLAPLRNEGICIIGSGNIVHNLGLVDFSMTARAFDWAHEFDRRTQELMTSENPVSVTSVLELSDAYRAVPTLEHFLPAAYIAGVVQASGDQLETFVDGGDWGSITMTSFQTV